MKQKRKVKSLISSNDESKSLLTTFLLLLGGILCFGALNLLTFSLGVDAADDSSNMEYEGVDDVQEVLFNLGFAPDGGYDTINQMYLSGNNFFVKGSGLKVDMGGITNTIDDDMYINLLGGEHMNIASDNITVIGGNSNLISEKNDNTAIIGGMNNTVYAGEFSNNAPVLVGGDSNAIGANQNSNAIIGGKNNVIGDNVSDSYIIGGSGNRVSSGSDNVIVGGGKVSVSGGVSNVFVFSDGDSSFSPEGSNAFYLNIQNGLGLNETAANSGVDSKGAVSFGEIDIDSQLCESQDIGVQGAWSGCLVGCTQAGVTAGGKWEMIDHGLVCEEKCKADPQHCYVDPIVILPPQSYTGFCTTNGVNTGNSTQCASNLLADYENVVFETYLIDSTDDCPDPNDKHNKCVFQCNSGFHLTGDIVGNHQEKVRCYSDCKLPWDETQMIKHNETITGYNVQTVSCSNNDYVFPFSTKVINFPTSIGSKGRVQGEFTKNFYDDRLVNGTSFESCINDDHEKLLVCDNGTLYVANSDRKTHGSILANGVTGSKYIYSGCTLQSYKCDTGVYNLTQNFIRNTANDTNVTWVNTDRSTSVGTRGEYKLCLDWNANSPQNGSSCSTGPVATYYHYQLLRCQDGYSTGAGFENECRKDCTLDGKTIHHNEEYMWFTSSSETCGDVCDGATFKCNDGRLENVDSNKPGATTGTYNKQSCTLSGEPCAGYNITQDIYDTHHVESIYDACQKYSVDAGDIFHCNTGDKMYNLTGCIDNWHTESSYPIYGKYCIPNTKTENCNTIGVWKPTNNSHYNIIPVELTWGGGWNWGSWVKPNCTWDCNTGYHEEDNNCIDNTQTASCESVFGQPDANKHRVGTAVRVYTYGWGSWGGCSQECNDGFEGDDCHEVLNPIDATCPVDYPSDIIGTDLNGNVYLKVQGYCDGFDVAGYLADDPVFHVPSRYCKGKNGGSDSITCFFGTPVHCEGEIDRLATNVSSVLPDTDGVEWHCAEDISQACTYTCQYGCDRVNGGCAPTPPTPSNSCQGEMPDGATVNSNAKPDNNSTYYFCNATSTAACAYTCPSGKECDGTSGCKDIIANCPCGYYNNGNSCVKCEEGKYSVAGSNSCNTCASGYHPTSDQCGCEADSTCSYNGRTYTLGATVQVYSSSSETCPDVCSKVTATCTSAGWDKEMNSTCTLNPSGTQYACSSSTVANGTTTAGVYYTPNGNTQCNSTTTYKVSCNSNYVLSGNCSCVPEDDGSCSAGSKTYNGKTYSYGAMSNGGTQSVSANGTRTVDGTTISCTYSATATCSNKTVSISNETETGCSGNRSKNCTGKPNGSVWVNDQFAQNWNNGWSPSNVIPTYSSNSSVECSYLCDTNNRYFYVDENCTYRRNFCTDTKYGCLTPATYTNTGGDDTKDTWDCEVDGVGVVDSCSKCKYLVADNGDCCAQDEIIQGGSCASSGCTFQGQTIPNGGSLTVYSSASPTCPTECQAGTVTCSNGQLGGNTNYTNLSCATQTNKLCSGDGWQYAINWTYGNVKTYDTCYEAAGSRCTERYKIIECEPGYTLVLQDGTDDERDCVEDFPVSMRICVGEWENPGSSKSVYNIGLLVGRESYNYYGSSCGPIDTNQCEDCVIAVSPTEVGNRMDLVYTVQPMWGASIPFQDSEFLGSLEWGGDYFGRIDI